ncbi:prevent-host-death protein [Mucilaginibacter celer]|uniref:Prevent-host-death protein n=1 Tax=Mucilaginibacter celer TaxID=2305508 RepID=A0A494VV49_9SPHI|nr:prevent-host-death protein [Mucilaginibacter celer]
MSVDEFKANFAKVINHVKAGENFAVNNNENKEVIGYFLAKQPAQKLKRKLGLFEGKMKIEFKPGFKMTDEEFCGYQPRV